MSKLRIVAVAAAVVIAAPLAWAAGLFNGYPIVGGASYCDGSSVAGVPGTAPVCNVTVPAGPQFLTGAEIVPADTLLPSGQQPQTVAIPSALLGNFSGTPRNYLDNGAMAVQQRGTGTVTCGTNTPPTSTAYSADRWVCDANVAVGVGRTALVTSTPTPPTGFQASLTVWRNSGALTQPVCVMQEIPSVRSTYLAGKTVTLSFLADALAGLSADNGNAITASIIWGTGTDQGFGTLTASPAITPAWTGIAFAANQVPITITTTFARYAVTAPIPATATEVGVLLCFTPTATGSGTTDGFAVTGVQLEASPSATAFEFQPFEAELRTAQARYYRFAEKAATYPLNGFCQATTANTNSCTLALPTPMAKIPTITITTAGTFKVNIANTLTTIATPTAGNCDLTACIVTAANTNTAGQVEQLTGAAGGSGVWEVSADF